MKLTIITVVYNAKADLELTLKSIRSQSVTPDVVVVDGGSRDGTAAVIEENLDLVKRHVSEKDKGIYDAMNKGIDLAPGEWIYFLNAGDVFHDDKVVEKLLGEIEKGGADCLYGDVVIVGAKTFQLSCDVSGLIIHHQGIIYKKALHDAVGKYVVAPGFTIADYFFFNLITKHSWRKVPFVFATCDGSGVSSKMKSYYAKMSVDFLFGRLTIPKLTAFVILYPIYKTFKTLLNFKSLYAK